MKITFIFNYLLQAEKNENLFVQFICVFLTSIFFFFLLSHFLQCNSRAAFNLNAQKIEKTMFFFVDEYVGFFPHPVFIVL